MKKEYVTPRIYGEEFVANEYVAACYRIRCTTPNDNDTYYSIYNDTNGNGTYDSGDTRVYSYSYGFSGCNRWHKGVMRDTAPTANGFVVKTEKKYVWGEGWVTKEVAEPVFWWKEKLGSDSDYHVMVPGKENYETNPNAS